MSEGEKKEKEAIEPKTQSCTQGDVLMVDTLAPVEHRGAKITLKVRGLTREESLWIGTRINEEGIKTGNEEITIAGRTVEVKPISSEIREILLIQNALRLGANEKISTEGWNGIEPRFITDEKLRKQFNGKKEIPCTVEIYLSLEYELLTKIDNRIKDWFNPYTTADEKN